MCGDGNFHCRHLQTSPFFSPSHSMSPLLSSPVSLSCAPSPDLLLSYRALWGPVRGCLHIRLQTCGANRASSSKLPDSLIPPALLSPSSFNRFHHVRFPAPQAGSLILWAPSPMVMLILDVSRSGGPDPDSLLTGCSGPVVCFLTLTVQTPEGNQREFPWVQGKAF